MPDKDGVTRDKADRPNKFRLGPDMSRLGLWNPVKKPDKAERPDMSELWAKHVWIRSLELG
jgi:hypothetical protein